MSQSSHPDGRPSGVTSILWGLLSIALFILVATIWIAKTGPVDVVSAERAQKRVQLREKLDQEDAQWLTRAAWVDKSKGVVQLPVGRAKEIAVVELKSRKQAPSNVALDPVLPLPPPYDPKSTEPQPPALPSSPQGADTIRFTSSAPAPDASQNNSQEPLKAK